MLSSQMALSEDVETSLALQIMNPLLATIDTIYLIYVNDQVTDGCLPYPNKLKDAAEIGLRRNGFVLETNVDHSKIPNRARIYIEAVGSKVKSICFAKIDIDVGMYRETKVVWSKEPADIYGDGQHVNVLVYHVIGGGVIIGPSDHIQSSMEKYVKNAMDDLFLDVSRARDHIFAKFPSIKK